MATKVYLLLAGLVALALLAGCSSSGGEPKIAFDREEVNFGHVPLDQVVEHTFKYRNVGEGTLVLRQVQVRTLEGC